MFFEEGHLKITKVRTADGITPLMNPATEKVEKKVVFAPANPITKKLFEEQNTRLPNGLKMKIEVVPAYKPAPIPQVIHNPEADALKLKIQELEAENAKLKQTVVSDNGNHTNGLSASKAEPSVIESNSDDKTVKNEKK